LAGGGDSHEQCPFGVGDQEGSKKGMHV
jgi:hypothetical protein